MSIRLDLALRIGELIGGEAWHNFFLASEAMMDHCINTMSEPEMVDMITKFLEEKIAEEEEDTKWE